MMTGRLTQFFESVTLVGTFLTRITHVLSRAATILSHTPFSA